MKKSKAFFLSMMMVMLPLSNVDVTAKPENVPLQVGIVDPTYDQGERPRSPIPQVSIEDYTLTFSTSCYGYTLELVDENDVVAFTTIITSDTLLLPSTLSGEYQLRLIPNDGNIYFYGYVMF
ncbi:MAG: hypothetical protein IJ887_13295 [Prevotella sp.]|nr:hypothetical protein [Prevotella sp.]